MLCVACCVLRCGVLCCVCAVLCGVACCAAHACPLSLLARYVYCVVCGVLCAVCGVLYCLFSVVSVVLGCVV